MTRIKEKRSEQVTLRLTPSEQQRLQAVALERATSPSDAMRHCITRTYQLLKRRSGRQGRPFAVMRADDEAV